MFAGIYIRVIIKSALSGILSKRAFINLAKLEFKLYRLVIQKFMDTVCNQKFSFLVAGNEYRMQSLKGGEAKIKHLVDECERIQNIGQKILHHKIVYSKKIPVWNLDPSSNIMIDNKFHLDLRFLMRTSDQFEKKIPWDLSRLQFVFTLLKGYILTENSKYKKSIEQILSDWIDKNPPFHGINWMNSMEVGIRSANLILLINWMKEYSFSDEIIRKINKSLLYHFWYIRLNPEVGIQLSNLKLSGRSIFTRNNHFIFALAGMVFLSFYFDNGYFKLYRKKAVRLFLEEIKKQVLPDGTNFEGSIAYHGFVLEVFLTVLILLSKNDYALPEGHKELLNKMLSFTQHYTRPDGTIPLIGDNDSGFYFQLSARDSNSHSYILSLGAIFTHDLKWICPEGKRKHEELFILFNKSNLFDNIEVLQKKSGLHYYSYPKGKYEIICDYDDRFHMVIRSGNTIKLGSGGHHHVDELSFDLFWKDKILFIDPGCYTYAINQWRNYFRDVRVHNTIAVNGHGPGFFVDKNKFTLHENGFTKILSQYHDNNKASLSMCFEFKNSNRFYRTYTYIKDKSELILEDKFEGIGHNDVTWFFHMPYQKFKYDEGSLFKTDFENVKIRLQLISDKKDFSIKFEKSFYAPDYGEKHPGMVCIVSNRIDFSKDCKIKYIISKI